MLAEALKAIEKDGTAPYFYYRAIHLQERLGKTDGAILTGAVPDGPDQKIRGEAASSS